MDVQKGGAEDYNRISVFSSTSAEFSQPGYEIGKAIDGDKQTGWAIDAPSRHKSGMAWLVCSKPFGFAGGTEVHFRLRFDGEHIQHSIGRSRFAITTAPQAAKPGDLISPEITEIITIAEDQRTKAQKDTLQKYYREKVAPVFKQRNDELAKLRKSLSDSQKAIPTSMVMEQMSNPRDTFMLIRGQYNNRGEKVTPGVPVSLSPLPKDAPANRLRNSRNRHYSHRRMAEAAAEVAKNSFASAPDRYRP